MSRSRVGVDTRDNLPSPYLVRPAVDHTAQCGYLENVLIIRHDSLKTNYNPNQLVSFFFKSALSKLKYWNLHESPYVWTLNITNVIK